MPTFRSTITAHIDATRKPPELPEVIHQVSIDTVNNAVELAQLIVNRLRVITDDGGMLANLNPFYQNTKDRAKRVWVPMHMLTYFESDINPMTGPMPSPDPNNPGQYVDGEGKKSWPM